MASRRSINFWDLVLYATAMNFGIRWLATAAAAGPASLPIWILAALGFSAIIATLAPSPDAADPLGASLKLVWSSAALIVSGVALYALAHFRRR